MNFVFFGTSSHSRNFLELLKTREILPSLIVTKPPQPIGRKRILTPNPCETFAKENRIPFVVGHGPIRQIKSISQVGLILDYARLIPPNIIDLFPRGIINIHFSRLPQFRGASPVQFTILTRQPRAWITWYVIDAGLDSGPLLYQDSVFLKMRENTEELYSILSAKAASLTKKVVEDYLRGDITPVPQTMVIIGEKLIRAERLTAEFCEVDWRQTAENIDALIRAAYPEPGAWTTVEINGAVKRLKLLKSCLKNSNLVLEEIQIEGKKPIKWEEFIKGHTNYKIKN